MAKSGRCRLRGLAACLTRHQLLLAELRLPAIKHVWASLAAQARQGRIAGGTLTGCISKT